MFAFVGASRPTPSEGLGEELEHCMRRVCFAMSLCTYGCIYTN
jgi:hypothetical protein